MLVNMLVYACLASKFIVKCVFVKQIANYFSEVRLELTKVTWPKRQEVIRLTLIVFAISAIVAGYVGGLDFVFTKLLGFVVNR